MSTVAARSFKEQHPDHHLTLGVGPQFKDMLPLFHDHPYFDAVHAYSTYDGWPGPKDTEYLKAMKFDLMFDGTAQHRDNEWWKERHQYAEACHMMGLPVPADINPILTRWFGREPAQNRKMVAFAPFGGNGNLNDKMLSVVQAQTIVDWLVDKGYMVLHLGAANEPQLEGAQWLNTCYFDSVRNMLSCRALIHCDTGLGHVAGAYNHLSLGLYGCRYFGKEWAHQIMPRHRNFVSVTADVVSNLDLDKVCETLTLLFS